jgi:uncharacterized membrane protein
MLVHETLHQHQIQTEQLKRLNREVHELHQEIQQREQRVVLLAIGGILVLCAAILLTVKSWIAFDFHMHWLEIFLGSIGGLMLLLAWSKK